MLSIFEANKFAVKNYMLHFVSINFIFRRYIIYNESKLDEVFLSYDKILFRLNIQNIKTKDNRDITHKDLRKAITVMQRKHKNCRWKSEKIRSKNSYILIEGYYWLLSVYFNNEKKLMDADIEFFEDLIKQYEELLKFESKNLFKEDIEQQDLSKYFNRKNETIEKAIWKMLKIHSNYRYVVNNEFVITKEGVEWLCKNCFKQKYLEILESYKMNLTEKFIKAGYIYDNFFNKN